MGGSNSGRYGGRPSIERTASFRLPINSFRGLSMGIRGRAAVVFHSTYDGEWPVTIEVNTLDRWAPYLELAHEPRNGDEGEVRYRVNLTTTSPHLGGVRWWFRCPLRSYRCGVLYLPLGGRHFASRRAYGLVYECQKETRSDRHLRRARKLNYALGGDGHEIPERPKGMWQRTYERKLAALELTQMRADVSWTIAVQPLLRKLGRRPRNSRR